MNTIKYKLLTFGTLFISAFILVFSVSAQTSLPSRALIRKSDSAIKQKSQENRLTTDKNNYAVGDNAAISGKGYNSFETVTVTIEQTREDNARILLATWQVNADLEGTVNTSWSLPYEGKFTIKIVGDQSNTEAVTQVSCVTPVRLSGNPSCATLNASTNPAFAHITSNYGLKIEPPVSATFTFTNGTGRSLTGGAPADPSKSVTTLLRSDKVMDWSSTRPITAVILKNGTSANVYPYNPALLSDGWLDTGSRNAISHIEFCFEVNVPPASITIIKDAQPNTDQAFSFTTSGAMSTNFSLIDNGTPGLNSMAYTNLKNFGAANTVRVTENPSSAPYSLSQISCVNNGVGLNNNTVNIQGRYVDIVLEEGENVTCTFVNAIPTAATVTVTGSTLTSTGLPLSRTRVTIHNTLTGEIRSVYTNNFGRYQFSDLEVGVFYLVTVANPKYAFEQEMQAFTLLDAMENLNFTALPR